ncbi:MAG: DUF1080 domain-containing protein [Pirellulaceae bacterium]
MARPNVRGGWARVAVCIGLAVTWQVAILAGQEPSAGAAASPTPPTDSSTSADSPSLADPSVSDAAASEGWTVLFDGTTMNGWRASEHKESWTLQDETLVCSGERSHLFYVGQERPFVNFEFQCETKTTPGSNAGIYFHTHYQESGWPKYGYECQVNISHPDPIKSGSLYGVANVTEPPAKDNEWYTTYIKVDGRRITVKINDKVVVDYTEEEGKQPFNRQFERRLGSGTFALQAHDPKSVVAFRNIKVRRLP